MLCGFRGFGFALAAAPLLSLFNPPADAVPLSVLLQPAAGLFDIRGVRRQGHEPSLRCLIPGALVGSPLGAAALAVATPSQGRPAIAVICAAGTLALARGFPFKGAPGPAWRTATGLAAGIFAGLAAVPGPPVVAYRLATHLAPARTRASLLVFFLVTAVAAAAGQWSASLVGRRLVIPFGLSLPLMLAGGWIGQRMVRRLGGRGNRPLSIAVCRQ